jgi:hypothetical protein
MLSLVGWSASAQTLTLSYRNTQSLGNGSAAGQLSGLTYLGGNDWIVVADKRNELLPINVSFNPANGTTTTITQSAKRIIGGVERDYEGIAFTGATRNTLLISEEDSPAVREFNFSTLAERGDSPLATPSVFLPPNLRGNLGFESLTYSQSTGSVFTANEEALVPDGATATSSQGTTVRIQRYVPSGSSFAASGQWAYKTDPIHGTNSGVTDPAAQCGLSDLVVLDDGRLLTLERSVYYTSFLGQPLPNFESRIYVVSPTGSPASADTANPLSKTLLWSGSLGLSGNLEGLALGPATANGRLVLGICDNADNNLLAANLAAFELTVVPEPGIATVCCLACGALLRRARPSTRPH